MLLATSSLHPSEVWRFPIKLHQPSYASKSNKQIISNSYEKVRKDTCIRLLLTIKITLKQR